ncbi:putative protein kinase RLK-Pelle-CrRLK1L-1 family [Helianthus annuus]|nr:putative protein kinase RLK-Pelle-CrRLK1L-1 family [Helianthus annuus]
MPSIEDVKHLQIPLWEISLATNGFAKENLIEEGGFGPVYKGISKKHGSIAVKRLVYRQMFGQGDKEFKTEIALLSKCKHENIVSLRGFCDEDGEKILVYRYESNGSLNKQLNNENLTWIQRLRICLDAACGLQYLHENVESQLGIFHRDVKSPNILLDEGWKAKISDFGLSRAHPANMQASFLISNPCGTEGYIDPDYRNTCHLTQKSDVYSFGVVLWEVLCGRLAYVPSYNDDRRYLNVLVEKHYIRKTLDKIIPSYLHKQMHTDSLLTFTKIASQCLKNREERPTMKEVVDQLQEAIDHQQILVYKFESNGSLDRHLNNKDLTRIRLEICLGVACGLQYLLDDNVGSHHGIFHLDVKSSNILLDEHWKAKISDFGLSRTRPANMQDSFLFSNPCGTPGYIDPDYYMKGYLTPKTDVYSFGVVLWEVLCGRLTHVTDKHERIYLSQLAQRHYLSGTLDSIIPSYLQTQINTASLSTFSNIAYRCLKNVEERPKMKQKKAKPATVDEKKGDGSFPPPPPQPQELVFSVYMHCKDCAKRVRRCLENFEGVEGVETDCENHKVVVKGEKADPLKVLERIHKETGRKVELLSPVTKPLVEEAKRLEQEKPSKREEYEKDEVVINYYF